MSLRIGINGFGRMGRLALRAGWGDPALRFVHVNEIACDASASAHLTTFDSVHGTWTTPITGEGDTLVVDGVPLGYSRHAAIADTDWSGCDLVLECTGAFRKAEQLQAYLDQGVRTVLVAAPVNGALNLVYGVNHHRYDPAQHRLITAASCTTNCLAPLVKVMHEHIGIVRGSITTIHDATNTQSIVDKGHNDLRRARAGALSLIPTSTGSAKAITQIFPELDGKLDGLAVRVPLLNASLTDFVFEPARVVTVGEVNALLHEAAEGELRGILGYEERPLVSIDYLNDPRSAVVDALSTRVVDGRHVKLLAWYDNEWGYVQRMIDLARLVAVG